MCQIILENNLITLFSVILSVFHVLYKKENSFWAMIYRYVVLFSLICLENLLKKAWGKYLAVLVWSEVRCR